MYSLLNRVILNFHGIFVQTFGTFEAIPVPNFRPEGIMRFPF